MPRKSKTEWTVSTVYRGEPIREDPTLEPAEKETVIAFDKTATNAVVLTWEAPLIKRLLAHPRFVVTRLLLRDGAVVYVEGTIPVGCLKILSRPRGTSSHAEIIARPLAENEAEPAPATASAVSFPLPLRRQGVNYRAPYSGTKLRPELCYQLARLEQQYTVRGSVAESISELLSSRG